MYLNFFNLREPPFNLTPDPRFLFLSLQHEEALSHLLYGIYERKGFIEITGEVGTGKTVLCRALLERLDTTVSTALIFNSYLTEIELLQAITSDFGLTPGDTTRKGYIDALNTYLLAEFAAGRNAVVLIDEAQNLEPMVLEQLRMLSNLETERGKLLQLVLVGQPELRAKLSTPQMRQLEQRIAVRFHIHELSRTETEQYIVHRLSVAGASHTVTWTRQALRMIHQDCGGIPRLINRLCDRALMSAYVQETRRITPKLVRQSTQELAGSWQAKPVRSRRTVPLLSSLVFAGLAGAGLLLLGALFLLTLPMGSEQFYPRLAEGVSVLSRLFPQPTVASQESVVAVANVAVPQPQVPAETAMPTPEVDVSFARTLWRFKTQAEEALARPLRVSISPWETVLNELGNVADFVVIPLQANPWHLQNVSRPCFLEVRYDATTARSTLWILVKILGDKAFLYQEPEGVVQVPLLQVQQRWSGMLYLTMEGTKYRGFALRPGMNGERVRVLQETLRDKGYFAGIPSGQFDAQTQQAVKRFQRDNQLLADGYVGRQTLLMLLHFGGETLAHTT